MKTSLITILGPTACGKTAVAAQVAAHMSIASDTSAPLAEIISADSRQVFRGMDIGTGKDLEDYDITLSHDNNDARRLHIPYHLIDIANAGEKYSVYHFQRDFIQAFRQIQQRGHFPILCGGTGLYIESILRGYNLVEVPVNQQLREQLKNSNLHELTKLLSTYKRLHNTTDVDTTRRAIRAIEIEEYYKTNGVEKAEPFPEVKSLTIGLDIPRELRRERISSRLKRRLKAGMIEEVRQLLDNGVSAESLISYGLEYRFVTLYLTGQISYDEMVSQLEIAIHQFAKRQMTYFRGMERRGVKITWIDATQSPESVASQILGLYTSINKTE